MNKVIGECECCGEETELVVCDIKCDYEGYLVCDYCNDTFHEEIEAEEEAREAIEKEDAERDRVRELILSVTDKVDLLAKNAGFEPASGGASKHINPWKGSLSSGSQYADFYHEETDTLVSIRVSDHYINGGSGFNQGTGERYPEPDLIIIADEINESEVLEFFNDAKA